MIISKQNDAYVIEQAGEQVAVISTYRNEYHRTNCYLKLSKNRLSLFKESAIFEVIAAEEQCPLQIMLASGETQAAALLASQGFRKVRQCYEVAVQERELQATFPTQESQLAKTYRGQVAYQACCDLLFHYYRATHHAINPLTATFDEFVQLLPNEVLFASTQGTVQHVAFIEANEIAYVSSTDPTSFAEFALAVVKELFATHQTIEFEADDVDWAAMVLKDLFVTEVSETFDTWLCTQ